MNPSPKPERLVFLDGIKVFALLMVFALHTNAPPLLPIPATMPCFSMQHAAACPCFSW